MLRLNRRSFSDDDEKNKKNVMYFPTVTHPFKVTEDIDCEVLALPISPPLLLHYILLSALVRKLYLISSHLISSP